MPRRDCSFKARLIRSSPRQALTISEGLAPGTEKEDKTRHEDSNPHFRRTRFWCLFTIYGQDACPSNTICVTRPEGERYRIPKELRPSSVKPSNQSWAVRAQGTINEARSAPSDCNNIGAAGGWTGCWADEMRKARASAQADRDAEKVLP
jgi:hypothetical protein